MAEAGGVREFLAYLDHIGVHERMLRVGRLDPALRTATAPMAVPARLLIELMERAAALLSRPDLGLHFAQWFNPNRLGALGLLGQHCTTFADRFRLARRYVHLQNNSVAFERRRDGEDVVVLCALHPALRPDARQHQEWLVALSVRNARGLLGAGWNPVRVEFAHTAPKTATQRRYFRCPVEYEADRDAFVMAKADFHRRLASGSQETVLFLENHLAKQAPRWPADLRGQVEHLVAAQLSAGGASLGTSPRTLQRRLAAQGEDFGSILAFVRTQVVKQHLAQHAAPALARLAHLLGYSEPSAASRFVRAQLGASARSLLRKSPSPLRGGVTRRDCRQRVARSD